MEKVYCVVKHQEISIGAKDYDVVSETYDVEEFEPSKIFWRNLFEGPQPSKEDFENEKLYAEGKLDDPNEEKYIWRIDAEWKEGANEDLCLNWKFTGFTETGNAYWLAAELYPTDYNFKEGRQTDGYSCTEIVTLHVRTISKEEYYELKKEMEKFRNQEKILKQKLLGKV